LLVVATLASMATAVQAAATALMTYDGSGCTALDQTFTVASGGDLCSGCTETTATTEGKGSIGTMYLNMFKTDKKNEFHVYGKANCPLEEKGALAMTLQSLVLADWDKLKKGECIDATLYILDDDAKTEKKSLKLTGTCAAATTVQDASMAKHATLGGLLIALVTMHMAFLGQ